MPRDDHAHQLGDDPQPLARRRLPSIRLRLTVWMVIIALVIQLTLGLVIFMYQSAALNALFNERIRQRSAGLVSELETRPMLEVARDLPTLALSRVAFPTDQPRSVAMYDAGGRSLGATPELPIPSEVFPGLLERVSTDGVVVRSGYVSRQGEAPWRYIVRRVTDATGRAGYLVVGRPDDTYHATLSLIRTVLLLSLPVGLLGAGVAGWLISGLAVAPVRQLRSVADTLNPESLQQPAPAPVSRVAEIEDVQMAIEDVRERLRLALAARDRFISHLSHEMKTPIAIILTEAQTLDTRSLPPDARTFVRSVIDEMRRLGRTIESFLTITKVRAGSSFMEHLPCDVADVVMDAVLGCSRMARQHRVSLNPLLPDTDRPPEVNGDAELLRVLMDHVLRGAIRATPDGSQVVIRLVELPDECVISVRDFGPPIADQVIPPAFGPAPDESPPPNGARRAGLGLSIAQTIARLHKGDIKVHAPADAGCEIAVHLPRQPSPVPDQIG